MQRLKQMREQAGMTQMQLAIESGLSLAAINYIESGKRRPTLETAKRIAKAIARKTGRDWGEVLKELSGGVEHAHP